MNKKKQFAKTTIIIFFGKVCTQLISFFLLPLYTAYLATSEYGLVDLIQTYVTLLSTIISGGVGISMAFGGYGVWSLVYSNLIIN